jgi:hypothetical protein
VPGQCQQRALYVIPIIGHKPTIVPNPGPTRRWATVRPRVLRFSTRVLRSDRHMTEWRWQLTPGAASRRISDTSDIYTLAPKLETYRSEIATHVRAALADGTTGNPITVFFPGVKVTIPPER